MIVKNAEKHSHAVDLEDVLQYVKKYNMCLNPTNCSFRIHEEKFLGFMLTNRGIEANPEKCQVVIDMKSHANVKEVQQNKGRLVALSCFLSCVGDKEFSFFVALKNKERFEWTGECEQAFSKIKSCLMYSFITRPREGSSLHLILSVTNQAMILVLVQDIDKV